MKPKKVNPTCPVCDENMVHVDGRWYCPYALRHQRGYVPSGGGESPPGSRLWQKNQPAEDGGPEYGIEAYLW